MPFAPNDLPGRCIIHRDFACHNARNGYKYYVLEILEDFSPDYAKLFLDKRQILAVTNLRFQMPDLFHSLMFVAAQ
jgi:hypothetical protein